MNNTPLTIGGATMKVGATYDYLFRSMVERWPEDCRSQFRVTDLDPVNGAVHIVWTGTWMSGQADEIIAHGHHPLQHLIGDVDSRIVTEVQA